MNPFRWSSRLAVALGAGVLLALVVAAFAQSVGVPTLAIPSPNGNEQIRTVNGGPQITNITIRQVRDAAGYVKIVPTAGQSLVIPNGASRYAMNPAGTLATLTITLPANPVDGQLAFIYTTQAITALTLNANTGQSINNAVTTMNAGSTANYLYSASNQTWDRD